MSVFPASFWREAAQAVVVVDGDIEAALGLLRKRSLLEWDADAKRYDLHDLVRAFGEARLEAPNTVRLRHAQYYLMVANQAENNLYRKGDALIGLALFDQERMHIDAGWRWARARAGDPYADALIISYADVTTHIGELRYDPRRERIPQLEAALEVVRRDGDRHREGNLLSNLGGAYRNLGELQKALDLHTKRLEIAQNLGDQRGTALALGNLGAVYSDLGKPHEAIVYYERSLTIASAIGNRQDEAIILSNLGALYERIGDHEQAFACYRHALDFAHGDGDHGAHITLGNFGLLLEQQGHLVIAAEALRTAVEFLRAVRDPKVEKFAARLDQLLQRLAADQSTPPAEKPDEG